MKLGCDPEAFLIDVQGQLHSAIGKIGGSKENPLPLVDLGDGYAVQEDNVAIEFNIPPAESCEAFVHSIKTTLHFLEAGINEMYGYSIGKMSAAVFPEPELDNPAAMVFGCDPDYNAWTQEANPKPKADDWRLRSCGGHVHVGFDVAKVNSNNLIQFMDLYLGVGSVLMDKGELRKQLYGKAGACRYKPYGAEYRTLSNFWVFNDRLIQWVWENTARALNAVESQLTLSEEEGQQIVSCINNNDKNLAHLLVEKYGLEVIHV